MVLDARITNQVVEEKGMAVAAARVVVAAARGRLGTGASEHFHGYLLWAAHQQMPCVGVSSPLLAAAAEQRHPLLLCLEIIPWISHAWRCCNSCAFRCVPAFGELSWKTSC
jgi:hypothetical protein